MAAGVGPVGFLVAVVVVVSLLATLSCETAAGSVARVSVVAGGGTVMRWWWCSDGAVMVS